MEPEPSINPPKDAAPAVPQPIVPAHGPTENTDGLAVPLPTSHVLSYVSNVSTPTRIRIVAATGMRIVALVESLFFVLSALLLASEIQTLAEDRALGFGFARGGGWGAGGGGGPITMSDYLWAMQHYDFILFLMLLWLSQIISIFALSPSVRAGRRTPCILANVGLVPLFVPLVFFTAGLPTLALDTLHLALVYHGNNSHIVYGQVAWLLVLPVGILLILLLKDLCGFLRWIERHPMADKPPVPFLAGGAAGQSSLPSRAPSEATTGSHNEMFIPSSESQPPLAALSSPSPSAPPNPHDAPPRLFVLGYLTAISTPTRVREVASRGMLLAAVFNIVLFAGLLLFTAWQIDHTVGRRAFFAPATWDEYKQAAEELEDWTYEGQPSAVEIVAQPLLRSSLSVRCVLCMLIALPAIFFIIFSKPVLRGRASVCTWSAILIMPSLALTVLITAGLSAYALFAGLGALSEPSALLWLLSLPPGVLFTLLFKDLIACLFWIARTPLVDKPPVPFIASRPRQN